MLKKCKCGGNARIRWKNGCVWIECRKCHDSTRHYIYMDIPFDTSTEELARIEWDKMNGGTGDGNVL